MIVPDLASLAWPVDDLELLPSNPRKGDIEAVARSYVKFGQRKPIVGRLLDDGTRVILAGNHQLLAARQLGWDKIAVVWTDDDDLTAKAYALADNRTAELGGYDQDLLSAMLEEVSVDADLLAASAFTDDDMARISFGVGIRVELRNAPDVGPPAIAQSRPGDVWTIGEHRLVVGDAGDTDVWDALLDEGEQAECVISRPVLPADGALEFLEFRLSAAVEYSKKGAAWFLVGSPDPSFMAMCGVAAAVKVWKQSLVWVTGPTYLPVIYGWKAGAAHAYYGDRRQSTLWEHGRPVDQVAQAIRVSTKPGAIVVDPFAGDGVVLAAAAQMDRQARLIEIDPRQADVICAAAQQLTGLVPVRNGDPIDFSDGD